jgi:hypothetical protein
VLFVGPGPCLNTSLDPDNDNQSYNHKTLILKVILLIKMFMGPQGESPLGIGMDIE